MKTIWKYPLEIVDQQTVVMPAGACPLAVQVQRGTPCLWMLVDDARLGVERTVYVFGTGHVFNAPPSAEYVGTVQAAHLFLDAKLVWHVWIDKGAE